MITFKDNINGLNDDTCVKVYDPADKKLIGVYPNYLATGNKLGISPSLVQQKCAKKTRVFSPTYGSEVACRLSRRTAEEDTLIQKSKARFL